MTISLADILKKIEDSEWWTVYFNSSTSQIELAVKEDGTWNSYDGPLYSDIPYGQRRAFGRKCWEIRGTKSVAATYIDPLIMSGVIGEGIP